MIYSHAIPVALVAAFTCSACPVADVRSSPSRTTSLNVSEEGVGIAPLDQRFRNRQMRVVGLTSTCSSGGSYNSSLGGKNVRCHPCRRVGGVSLLSRAVRGGSSTPSDVTTDLAVDPLPPGYTSVGESYHLIWSPSFGKKILMSTIILFAVTRMLAIPTIRSGLGFGGFLLPSNVGHCHSSPGGTIAENSPSALSRLLRQLLLPLLSSSCCAVQLVINIIGIGCAGLNTVLGPTRPFFLSLLVYSAASSYPGLQAGLGKWCRNTTISFFFALMPELLHKWNNHSWSRREGRAIQMNNTCTMNTDANVCVTVELDIPSMGCAACINKIDSTLSVIGGVINGRSWLIDDPKGGRARMKILAKSHDDIEEIIKSVVERIAASGFPCTVDTVAVTTVSQTVHNSTQKLREESN